MCPYTVSVQVEPKSLSVMVLMWGIGSCVSRCVECQRIFRGCKKGCRKNDSCYGIPLMVCVCID